MDRIFFYLPLIISTKCCSRLLSEHYPSHLEPLVQQCMEWCDAYSSPILVPLSSWLPDPRSDPPLVTTVMCDEGGGVTAICPTPSVQHLFVGSSKNGDIKMYHVASGKLIRSLTGRWRCGMFVACICMSQGSSNMFTACICRSQGCRYMFTACICRSQGCSNMFPACICRSTWCSNMFRACICRSQGCSNMFTACICRSQGCRYMFTVEPRSADSHLYRPGQHA